MKSYLSRLALLPLLLQALFLQACKDEEVAVHPEVQTLEFKALSATSVLLTGKVLRKGTFPVEDYGFIVGMEPDLNETWGAVRMSLGKDIVDGDFSKQVDGIHPSFNQDHEHTLFARAYLTNNQGTMFGQVLSVTLPSPKIQQVAPLSGKAGELVTISGELLLNPTDAVEVYFGTTRANVVQVSATKVVAEIPAGIYRMYLNDIIPVYLKFGEQKLTATSAFKVIPGIHQFFPLQAPMGGTISITGDNFPQLAFEPQHARVFFDDIEAKIASYDSDNKKGIKAIVPGSITKLKSKIKVYFGDMTELQDEFILLPPKVTEISPAMDLPGSALNIYGIDFFAAFSEFNWSVTIGNRTVPIHFQSPNLLSVTVPFDLPKGQYEVAVKAGPFTVVAPKKFEVILPELTGFTPAVAGPGQEVILEGNFLYGIRHKVNFGSFSSYDEPTTTSTIRTNVPAAATPGKVKLSVSYEGTVLTAPGEFEIVTPAITSFTPASGVAGTVVTINSQGFNLNADSRVFFNNIQTNVVDFTANSIRAVVPSNLAPGTYKISVSTYTKTIVSTENFTITN